MSGPSSVRPFRSSWPALSITVLARAALAIVMSLLAWSLVPALLGWHTTVVMTGSMLPHLVPGDVVVSRPIDPTQVHIGQVLLVDSPDQLGELRMHRLVRIAADGRLILRGDANPTPDSSPVARSAVHGVGALHIPKLGLPYLWAADGQFGPLVLSVAGFIVLIALARWWRPAPRAPVDDTVDTASGDDPDTDVDPDDDADSGRVADEPGRRPERVVAGSVLWRRCLVVVLAAAVVVAATAGGADAVSPYSGLTTNPTDSWAASTYFTCANAVKADGAQVAYPMSESSGTAATDISGNNATGTYSGTITYGTTGPCTHDNRTAVTFNGTTSRLVAGGTAPSGTGVSFEIWFKASGTHGGVLMSLLNSGGNAKVSLAMTTTGSLIFANGSATASVVTTTTYNDNVWHLAVATVSSSGLALYVDTANPVTYASSTSLPGGSSTLNIGFGNAASLSTGSFNVFQGGLGFAATYATALTQTQVAAHYRAAN